ncbi:MAG TPA: amidohydrolase family protein [Burkholderiaceae bacterium]|nr:amidohydrolase family protein [Burkholderiaceae bacterium]
MIIDAHLNTSGVERASDLLRVFDEANVDAGVLLAPFLCNGYTLHDPQKVREANDFLSKLVRGHEDRLVGLAIVNPLHDDAPDEVRRAIDTKGLVGLKMVPTGWLPEDDCARRVFEVASELELPVLFHSGIFIDGRSGRYCRPANYEVVRDYPGMRVVLAHLGWPWTDESIAVGLIDRINGVPHDESQIRFDFSWGAPPAYRLSMLRNAIDLLSPAMLQFGSDRVLPVEAASIREAIDEVNDLLDQLNVDAAGRERIFAGTAANWLKWPKQAHDHLNQPFIPYELNAPSARVASSR